MLQELRTQTGLEYTVPQEEADRPISVAFTALPLRTGLARILAPVDHAILFDARGMPVQVIIGKKTEGGEAGAAELPPGRSDSGIRSRSHVEGMDVQRPRGVVMDIQPAGEVDFPVFSPTGGSEMEITLPERGEVMEVNPPRGTKMDIRSGQ